MMRRNRVLHGWPRLLSALLVLSLLAGLWAPAALAAAEEPEPPSQEQELQTEGTEEPVLPPAAEDLELPPPEDPAPLPDEPEPAPDPEELPPDPELEEVLDLLETETYELEAPTAEGPDRNILIFALREAQKAVKSGLLEKLASSAPADLKSRFEAAVREADALYRAETVTYEELQAAYLELQEVMWLLSYVQADKTALQLAVDRAAGIDLSGYTAASAGALREALNAARALLDRDDLNTGHQAEIAAAVEALNRAVDGLEKDSGGNQPGGNQPGGDRPGSSGGSSGSSGGSSRPKPTATPAPTPAPTSTPGVTPTPAPVRPPVDPSAGAYADVKPDTWYAEGVAYVSSRGIMQGTGNGQFSPDMQMSRAMIWTMLCRMDGTSTQGGSLWYSLALDWVREKGISDGSDPEGGITREQLAVMFYRYAGGKPVVCDLTGFSDSVLLSDWSADAMRWAVKNGLINGKSGGLLDPQGTATRAEAAVIFMRFMDLMQNV